jgi:transposase
MPRPPAAPLPVTNSERRELLELSRHRSVPQSIALRVKVVLGAADGIPNKALARQLSTTLPTVLLWRQRYEAERLAGIIEDRPRVGRPKQISEDAEAAIVEATMKTKPKDATHWSVRAMAQTQGVSPASVYRIWRKHKLQPHRVESFRFSSDPEFVPKVRDIVGLYLNPPDKALVLSVDEKSQIQALDRTQPILPLRPFGATEADLLKYVPKDPRYLEDPWQATLKHSLEARNFVEDIYRLNLRDAFQKKDDQEARELVCKRMAAGAAFLRDLAYTAWIESAKPVPPVKSIDLPENPDNPKYNPATGSAPAPAKQ